LVATGAVAAGSAKSKRLGLAPYALLLPSLCFLLVFFASPMIQSFALALRDETGWSLASMSRMLGDDRFFEALRTTVLLLVLVIPVQFVVAMGMALVVNARLKGSDIWLYLFALPLGISELAAGIIWFDILTEQGWLNSVLQGLGVIDAPIIFLNYQNPFMLIIAVVVAEAWRATSIIMVILVAGLQSIPSEYGEAADVFGANWWQKIWGVLLPQLRPSLRVALILRTVLAIQVFAPVIALAGRGLTVLSSEAYDWYVDLRDPNVAAAYAAVILLLSIVSTVLFLWLLPVREERS
jgi:multiple sugar transport system permease protein